MVGLLVAIVAGIAAPAFGAASAAADPVSDAKSQVAALEQQVQSDGARLHQLTQTYNADALEASELGQQAQAATQRVQTLGRSMNQNETVVRAAAVASYTGEVAAPPTTSVSPLVSGVYLDATIGNIHDTEDQLKIEQRQAATELTTLRTAVTQQNAQLQAAASARQQALSEAATDQQQLQADQQELTTLLASVPPPSRPPAVQGVGTGLATAVASQLADAGPAQPALTATPPAAPPTTGPTTSAAPGTTAAPTTTAAPPTTAPAPPPTTAPPASGGNAGGVWLELRQCESGDNYQENTGNGFYGAYQFSATTWTGLGYPGRPDLEPPAMQDQAAQQLQRQSGWGQWPACSAALGLT